METLNEIFEAWALGLDRSISIIQFAHEGLRTIHHEYGQYPRDASYPDSSIILADRNPNDPAARVLGQLKLDEALAITKNGGEAHVQLDHQWIVSSYQEWEDDARPRLAHALGISRDDLKLPLMGDLRRLRNDVVHHRGLASTGQSARTEVLHWFAAGERIALKGKRLWPAEVHQLAGEIQALCVEVEALCLARTPDGSTQREK